MSNISVPVIFTCGREPQYPRNQFLQTALRKFYPVESITSDSKSFVLRYFKVMVRCSSLFWRQHILCVVGFVGQPLIIPLHIISRKPLLFDVFVSVYDTLVNDRQNFSANSIPAKLAYLIDKISCTWSNLILIDTQAHAEYFHKTFKVPREKLEVLYVGCDENIFYPINEAQVVDDTVLYYSSFLPLHGTETVIRAAHLLQQKKANIRFQIVGNGMEMNKILHLAKQLKLENVDFIPPVPLDRLPDYISKAAVCLGGHFGVSDKARRVIAGKTYQCIAMGKPTIVGENPANHELLTHGKDAWFCTMNSPESLSEAILTLMGNQELRIKLGEEARKTYLALATYEVLGSRLKSVVDRLLEIQRE